jgi:regulator of nucleoside diphosphate kinase
VATRPEIHDMPKLRPAQGTRPRIVVTESELVRLIRLAEGADESPVGEYLAEELSRAFVVPDDDIAPHVARMGSQVTYREDRTSRIRKVKLVYPQEANIGLNFVSVLTPIGAALIGLSPAQTIQWPSPTGEMETLTVLEVSNEADAPQLSPGRPMALS